MYYAVEMSLVCAHSFLKVSYGNDAKQVSAAPTQAQKTNLAIVNSLYFLIQEVKSVSAPISPLFFVQSQMLSCNVVSIEPFKSARSCI